MVRVLSNGLRDMGSIPGQDIPKTQKMVLDAFLLNTQYYKVQIKSKVDESWEKSSTLPYTLVLYLSKWEPSGHPRLRSPTLRLLTFDSEAAILGAHLHCNYSLADPKT